MSVQSRRRRTYLAADDRRAQILAHAKDVFAREGYHGANVDQICQAAKIARGTLYQYFENKRDVLVAFVSGVAARVEQIVAERPRLAKIPGLERARLADIKTFCRTRLTAALEAIFADEATLRIVLGEARGADGVVEEALARIDDLLLGAMEEDVRAAQRAGLLRPMAPALVARYVLGGIEKMVLRSLADDERVDLGKIVDAAIEIQLFGLLTEKAVNG